MEFYCKNCHNKEFFREIGADPVSRIIFFFLLFTRESEGKNASTKKGFLVTGSPFDAERTSHTAICTIRKIMD
ncbi:MAG TPA: hypothetical protein DC013_06915 [Ruminococcaceae bacterium]|nr:hypothetical protein [Oscillospiraceae bacterium]